MKYKVLNLHKIKNVHFVGIKGVAMTSLALWFYENGAKVTGSDNDDLFPTDAVLKSTSIKVNSGFSPDQVSGELVIYTGAHGGRDNCEVKEALVKRIPVLPHGRALGLIMDTYPMQLSIAGCHGKTTTSAMAATIFNKHFKNTAYAVGSGLINGLGLPGHYAEGEWFIAEADEYALEPGYDLTPRFLCQNPDILLITNIDYDHPDVYKDIEAVRNAYINLAKKLKGNKTLILNQDDPNSRILKALYPNAVTYGISKDADYKIERIKNQPPHNSFRIYYQGKISGEFQLKVPGLHNIMNATGALIAAKYAGISFIDAEKYLGEFGGVSRRFEYLGKINGVDCLDDYAHHPNEINATLTALSEWYKGREIIVLFQPHTYSRTLALLQEFSSAFKKAAKVRILPIYGSAREKQNNISSSDLVSEIAKIHGNVDYWHDTEKLKELLKMNTNSNSVIISMGAGDIGNLMRTCLDK